MKNLEDRAPEGMKKSVEMLRRKSYQVQFICHIQIKMLIVVKNIMKKSVILH